jgi:biopolymer transport protein ExbB/TolQ
MLLLPLAKSNSLISSIPPETIPIIILIVSVVALTIIIERMLYFGRFKTLDPDSFKTVKELLREKKWDEARDILTKNSRGPVTEVLNVAIEHRRREHRYIEDELKTEAYRQIFLMEKYLTGLGTIATISPLLGVLGTVTGMIRSFAEGTGTKGAEVGISEALITTAMGLAIAIPAYIFYNYLVRKKEEKISEMENLSEQILPILLEK